MSTNAQRKLRATIDERDRMRPLPSACTREEGTSIAQIVCLVMVACGVGAILLTGVSCGNRRLTATLQTIEREERHE